MTDVLTKTQRSFNMSRIRSENTNPEIKFRDFLHSYGIKSFKMHPSEITGKPDFYFPKEKMAIFIDGCFWHGCKKCFRKPETNRDFWLEKITNNIKRDSEINSVLRRQGLQVVRFWEHEIKNSAGKRISVFITKLKKISPPKVLDLFAGAGGLSEGFLTAGFDLAGHIEMDKNACETIETRLLYYALKKKNKLDDYKKYLLGKIDKKELIDKYNLQKEKDSVIHAKISKKNYKKLIRDVRKKLNGQELDIIIGGPPCQSYSYIGRARDKNRMKCDSRNYLYKYYVEFLKALKPRIFIFENVPGLLTAGKGRHLRNMRKLMKKAGYDTDYKLLNAADFGVPQSRKRIVLIGWNNKSKLKAYPEFKKVEREYMVKDFLEDLPKLTPGNGVKVEKYRRKSVLLQNLGITNLKVGLLVDHISRPHNKRDLRIYKMAVLAKQNGKNIKYNELPKKLKNHKNEKGFLNRFRVIDYSSLACHTIVAHIAKDGHYYIHPDIKQNRSMSVREAARLQTFPDDFKFEGSRTSQFRQIGNAVPPIFSSIIAKELIKYL